jgi:hypothetical protein
VSALLALAERCEAATGSDRDLDADIAIELFDGGADHLDDPRDVTRARKVIISHGAQPGNFEVVGFSGVSLRTAPTYTASLDAAMTLVPEGLAWTLGQNVHHRHWQVSVNALDEDGAPFSVAHGGDGDVRTTPALALCAAALRAHAVQS